MDIGYIIAFVDLMVGVAVLYLGTVAARRLTGSTLFWSALLFLLTGVFFVVHAGVEVAGFGEELYALTALVATLFLLFTMVVIDITVGLLGV